MALSWKTAELLTFRLYCFAFCAVFIVFLSHLVFRAGYGNQLCRSLLLPCHLLTCFACKLGVYSLRKEFAPQGANSVLKELTPLCQFLVIAFSSTYLFASLDHKTLLKKGSTLKDGCVDDLQFYTKF